MCFSVHSVIRSVSCRCLVDYVKRSFYCAAKSIFAEVGRLAFEEVTLQLVVQKCVPVKVKFKS